MVSMNKILDSLLQRNKFSKGWSVNDIIVFSKTEKDRLEKLEKVFKRLKSAGLTLKPSKCVCAKKEVNILGHIVSEKRISPNENKLKSIIEFPMPKSVKTSKAIFRTL